MATLGEELLLLAYDDETGRDRSGGFLDIGLGGAVLYELALAGRIGETDGKVLVLDAAPLGVAFLDARLAAIADDRPRTPLALVERTAKDLKRTVRDALVAEGVLRHERDTVLGVLPYHRYLPQDPAVEADARARLGEAADTGRAPDARTAALAALVSALRIERAALPDREVGAVRKAFKRFGEDSWVGRATRKAVDWEAVDIAADFAGGG